MFRHMRVALVACLLWGCAGRSDLSGPRDAGPPDAEPIVDAGVPLVEVSEQVDFLLVVDNSRNLEDAQDLLAKTLPYLLGRIAKPACVNGLGNVVADTLGATDPCPVGEREMDPLTDVHIGVISTSLGGHGADVCSPASPAFKLGNNDAAHLLTRSTTGEPIPTYQNAGFLAWDPGQAKTPPGESDLTTFRTKLVEMVGGVGTTGCGFESQLESIYRFLVDPEPYASIEVQSGKAVPSGVDSVLLAQRAAFLRPESAVVVVLLTDENDCSTIESGQYWLSNQSTDPAAGGLFHLPRARAVCAAAPDDPCCASCGQPTPTGCSPTASDPSCVLGPLTSAEDPINLRCFDQKRRFGVDFLYPVERYVEALRSPTVPRRDGAAVPNPLFTARRSPSLVMLAGIVGVPWQDIAIDASVLATGYRPAREIDWAAVVGDPATKAPPTDPLMIESIGPRAGTSPATGATLAPPGSSYLANPVNGHERLVPAGDDLQYACIYPLATPKPCADASTCDCGPDAFDGDPICQASDGTYGPVKRFARAVPGTRVLRVLAGLGDQAVVASVCAQNVDDTQASTFAYRPAVDAIMRALRLRVPHP